MMHRNLTVTLSSLALALAASACDNGSLTDVNRNPNAPETVDPSLLFPQAAVSSIQRVRSDIEITPSAFVHWPQYMAEYQYPEISYYQFRPTTSDGWWANFYNGPIEDLEQSLRLSEGRNLPNQVGPELVIRAFDYSTMTGLWGDIPFSQAGKGDSGNFTPVYDSQQSIYDSLLTNLKDANTMMDASLTGATALGFGDQDPVYAGDVDQWKKFANSLRARLGLNLSKADPARAQAEVAAAIAAGGFTSNADNAQITWPGDGVNNNPWCNTEKDGDCGGTRDDARMSVTFIDTLKSLNDPRLTVFALPVQDPTCGPAVDCTPVAAGDYRGMPNGLLAGQAGNWGPRSSRPGPQIYAPDQPSYFMTYAEFSFIKAEAAMRGWIPGGAAAATQYYNEGITASMEQWGLTAADAAAYIAQPQVALNAASLATALPQIITQKWIALFTQGYEAWSEWRRTGYPDLTMAQNAVTTTIPRRVLYPQSEQSFNNSNLQAAITSLGTDALETKMWIDKP
ncbi:MAG TPA: SusD/RagB family nutrient-binding outer membrane lipoprotein [Gemmatimonadaceae bacterium]|nr:SusD/RagB family nutrient-binding outer membrane lipoprotein [Gemmatimonadaceae bacterium]